MQTSPSINALFQHGRGLHRTCSPPQVCPCGSYMQASFVTVLTNESRVDRAEYAAAHSTRLQPSFRRRSGERLRSERRNGMGDCGLRNGGQRFLPFVAVCHAFSFIPGSLRPSEYLRNGHSEVHNHPSHSDARNGAAPRNDAGTKVGVSCIAPPTVAKLRIDNTKTTTGPHTKRSTTS
jgi:hypothetical protein